LRGIPQSGMVSDSGLEGKPKNEKQIRGKSQKTKNYKK